jgi:hypothetical protein
MAFTMTKAEALSIQAKQVEHYAARVPDLAKKVASFTFAETLVDGKTYTVIEVNKYIPRGGRIESLFGMLEAPVKFLYCTTCGARSEGRQWSNLDTGFGICADCATWKRAKHGSQALYKLAGIEGVHYMLDHVAGRTPGTPPTDLLFQVPTECGFLVIQSQTEKGREWITQTQSDLRGYTNIDATHKAAFKKMAALAGLSFVDVVEES